jgi:TolA-binding protein
LDKELKRQIKEDELKSALEHTLGWARAHGPEVRITALVALVLAGVLGAVAYFQSSQSQQAMVGFAEAVATARTPVASATEPAGAGAKTFAAAAEKHAAAAAAFDGVARRFPSRPEGLRARYLAAVSRVELGEYAAAEKALTEIAGDRRAGALEPALARLALAELQRRAGQLDKAAEAYRQIVNDPGSAVPRDVALLGLAESLEDAGKLAEAQAAYERVFREFPGSVYAADARRRADRLESAVEG